jgi:hypothetical protein
MSVCLLTLVAGFMFSAIHLVLTGQQATFASRSCAAHRAHLVSADVSYGRRTALQGDVRLARWIPQLQWACQKHHKTIRFYKWLSSVDADPSP